MSRYSLKRVSWPYLKSESNSVFIVTQNTNGPCSLIALFNTLVLQGHIQLSKNTSGSFGVDDIVKGIRDVVIKDPSKNDIFGDCEIYELVLFMFKLEDGLTVNLKFDDIYSFENSSFYMKLLSRFDILLCHGWVVDPSGDQDMYKVIGNATYNDLILRYTVFKNKLEPSGTLKDEELAEMMTIEHFLNDYSNQMTPYGLGMLKANIRNGTLAILFLNNHFHALFNHGGQLLLLVTDESLAKVGNVAWQVLDDPGKSPIFLNDTFSPINTQSDARESHLMSLEHLDHDFAVALSLQEGQAIYSKKEASFQNKSKVKPKSKTSEVCLHDGTLRTGVDASSRASVSTTYLSDSQCMDILNNSNSCLKRKTKKKNICTIL